MWELRKENLEKFKQTKLTQPDIPYWLKLLVDKCLEKNAE